MKLQWICLYKKRTFICETNRRQIFHLIPIIVIYIFTSYDYDSSNESYIIIVKNPLQKHFQHSYAWLIIISKTCFDVTSSFVAFMSLLWHLLTLLSYQHNYILYPFKSIPYFSYIKVGFGKSVWFVRATIVYLSVCFPSF